MSKLPETKQETRNEEKKGGGLFGFLSRLGGGGGSSAGRAVGSAAGRAVGSAAGGAGSLGTASVGVSGGAGLAGGLLATKAGLVALIVAGSSVAGGIGFVGYKTFGSGNSGGGLSAEEGGELQVFAPKPVDEAQGDGSGTAPSGSGDSQSLSMFVQANQEATPNLEPIKAAGATQTTDGAAAAASASVSASAHSNLTSADSGGSGSGAGGGRAASRLGALGSSRGGGGGSSASFNAGAARAAATGQASGMGGGSGATGKSKGLMRAGGGGATRQAIIAHKTSQGATTSQAAGVQFDGGARRGGLGGGSGSGGGVSVGGGKVGASGGNQIQDEKSPFTKQEDVAGSDVTPWGGALKVAMYCILGALAMMVAAHLLFKAAYELRKTPKPDPMFSAETLQTMGKVACGIALAAAAAAMAIGAMIAFGKDGQLAQGLMYMAAGAGIGIAAADPLFINTGETKEGASAEGGEATNTAAADPAAPADAAGGKSFVETGNPSKLMWISGGAGIAAFAVVGLGPMVGIMKPKEYPASRYKDDDYKVPGDWGNSQVMPSDRALEQYFAAKRSQVKIG